MDCRATKYKKYSARRTALITGFWLLLTAALAPAAAAQVYQCTNNIYFVSNANNNVYQHQPGTNAVTQITGAAIGAPSAGAAVTPLGDRLYSIDGAKPFNLRFNSGAATNTIAAAAVAGSTVQRTGISRAGVGYFMVGAAGNLQYFTFTTGGATSTVSAAQTLTLQPATAPAVDNSGDTAFDDDGISYLLDQAKNFYRLDFTANQITYVGAVTGMGTDSPNGLGFTSTSPNSLFASTVTTNRLFQINLSTLTAALITPTTTVAGFTQNDIASCNYPAGVAPSVAAVKAWRNVTRGDAATFATQTAANAGDTLEYRVVVRNSGAISAGNTTFQDVLPAGVTYVAATTTLNGVSVADATGTGNAAFAYQTAKNINGVGQGVGALRVDSTPTDATDNEATVIFRVTVNNPFAATAPIINTAQVNYAGAPAAVNSNAVSTPVNQIDLQIAKSHTGNFTANSTGTYTLTVKNAGGAANAGAITVVDALPSGLSVNAGASGAVAPGGANAANRTCNSNAAAPQSITCTSATAITAGASSVFTLTVNAAANAPAGSVTNNATVAGGGEPAANNGNNGASDPTTILGVYTLSGVVFEDVGYAGGAGRNLLSAGGVGRGGARVELYNSSGAFVAFTTTATTGTIGQYQFTNLTAGTYTARVVDSTVTSSRTGAVSTLLGVQTFRTNGGADDTNRVGGEDPTKAGSGANTTNATLASLTMTTSTPQSIGAATVSTANVTGVDFGFNFDTVVNTNDSGQGSLRQFITNANALSGADRHLDLRLRRGEQQRRERQHPARRQFRQRLNRAKYNRRDRGDFYRPRKHDPFGRR